MDATHGLAAILRDARKGALLRMRSEIYSQPRKRGIQCAASSQLNRRCSGILDHPLSRMMTGVGVDERHLNSSFRGALKARTPNPPPTSLFKQPHGWPATPPRSRGAMRPSCARPLAQNRGRGERRVPLHPQPRVRSVESTRVSHYRFSRFHPAFPHAMVLTAYSVLSPVIGLVCHRHPRIKVLSARSGSQNLRET
jgi:hypothetical protein